MKWFQDDMLRLNSKSFFVIFAITLLLYATNMGIYNYYVWNDDVYATQNGGILNRKAVDSFRLIDLLRLVLSPIVLFFKLLWVALILQLILLVSNVKNTITETLKIAAIGQVILIFGDVLKTIFFLFLSPTNDRDTIDLFYPFSLLNWIEDEVFAHNYLNMLMSINIFELFYVIAVGYLLKIVFSVDQIKATLLFGTIYILCIATFYISLWLIK